MKRLQLLSFCAVLVACSSTTVPSAPPSVASVTVRTITPAPEASINSNTVFDADIDYTITNFSPSTEYYLAPLFDSAQRVGGTFNEFHHVTDGIRIRDSAGSAHIHYPIAREWKTGKLTRPVRLHFYLMVRTGPNKTTIIGKSEIFQFSAGV
jgi:hypothetical protein